jgi:hypothetical protein
MAFEKQIRLHVSRGFLKCRKLVFKVGAHPPLFPEYYPITHTPAILVFCVLWQTNEIWMTSRDDYMLAAGVMATGCLTLSPTRHPFTCN